MARGLVEGILARDRGLLARAISLVEAEGADGDELYRQVCSLRRDSPIVAFTGPPGVGKSTLVGAYIGYLRREGKTVAVAAVDPSSPLSGGAILGDRLRMVEHDGDEGVFIRSLASRGQAGGLSAALYRVADVLSAAAYDVVIVETVGSGQVDVAVADVADVKVVVGAPGLGDHVQAIKAGILEIADILVLNKADTPHAEQAFGQLEAMLKLRAKSARDVPVVATIATLKSGIPELAAAIGARLTVDKLTDRPARDRDRARKLLAQAAARAVMDHIAQERSAHLARICDEVATGRASFTAATAEVIGMIAKTVITAQGRT